MKMGGCLHYCTEGTNTPYHNYELNLYQEIICILFIYEYMKNKTNTFAFKKGNILFAKY